MLRCQTPCALLFANVLTRRQAYRPFILGWSIRAFMDFLLIVLLLPLAGAVFILLIPEAARNFIRPIALLTALLTLLVALSIAYLLDFSNPAVQLLSQYEWNPRLGTYFIFGLDGFSYPLVVLTSLLSLLALSVSHIQERIRTYYSLMLLVQTAATGVFLSQGWALFYVFWEMVLIPLFFLINRWGSQQRQKAALNFVLYTLGGSIFMLLSLLVLFDKNPEHSFLFASIQRAAHHLSAKEQTLIFLGLLLGFGVKLPIFPLHGWLPLADVEAPTPVTMLLSGVLLKMGAYGLIRSVEMLPLAAINLQNILFTLGATGIVYGGLLAWRQSDMKRLVAYASISHMGGVLIGIASLTHYGIIGALFQMIAHGLIAAALFMLLGLLHERTQRWDINDYGAMIKVTPYFALFIILAFVGAVGLPGSASFIAELHLLLGGFQQWSWAVIVLPLGVLITATYSVRTIKYLYTGPSHPELQTIRDLSLAEKTAAATLIMSTLILGFYPTLLLQVFQASVERFIHLFVG